VDWCARAAFTPLRVHKFSFLPRCRIVDSDFYNKALNTDARV
jgi:hypothetical protein